MSKLRTLKDMEFDSGDYKIVYSCKLRQEAIKWYKLTPIEMAKQITGTPKILLNEIIKENVAITKAFIKLFNITKEELLK